MATWGASLCRAPRIIRDPGSPSRFFLLEEAAAARAPSRLALARRTHGGPRKHLWLSAQLWPNLERRSPISLAQNPLSAPSFLCDQTAFHRGIQMTAVYEKSSSASSSSTTLSGAHLSDEILPADETPLLDTFPPSSTAVPSYQSNHRRWITAVAGVVAAAIAILSMTLGKGTRYCSLEQIADGEWQPAAVDSKSWEGLKTSVGYNCEDNFHHLRCVVNDPRQLSRVAAASSWRWVPRSCELRPFDRTALSRRLGRRARGGLAGNGILFVGDSISQEQLHSLRCMLGAKLFSGRDAFAESFALEKGTANVDYIRSDYIVQPDDWQLLIADQPTEFDRRRWTHLVEDKEFVVLNTGAHWGNADKTPIPIQADLIEKYSNMIIDTLKFFDDFPHVTLIVRASVPGHAQCSQYYLPLSEDKPDYHSWYNWNDLETYNNLWKVALLDQKKHLWLDASPLSFRGDGHTSPDEDCLHYCMPGRSHLSRS